AAQIYQAVYQAGGLVGERVSAPWLQSSGVYWPSHPQRSINPAAFVNCPTTEWFISGEKV
ncbi:MAG: hypothetical protein LBV50_11360, partial [Novosphingobium sp.]|nr:hypothetical protein [Novosphingobium sp.]